MQSLGRYQLIRKLAGGGMAEIHLARLVGAAGFEKDVAVKMILPQFSRHADFVAMLADEAKIAVRLSHPNIVQVYELAHEGEIYFIAMEYVPGWDARKLLQSALSRKAAVPLEAVLILIGDVLEGLAYAHEKTDAAGRPLGIVHRDISPQNVLISHDGAVKIADFGIAKAASRNHETATGVLKGKFSYMSPEQAFPKPSRESPVRDSVDARSDLFSTAVLLYELATGERLFYRGSDAATLDAVRSAEFKPSEQARGRLPAALVEILRKALRREPSERYQSAREFRKALVNFARTENRVWERDRFAAYLKEVFKEAFEDEEKTVVVSEATRTEFFSPTKSETLVAYGGPEEGTRLILEDTEKSPEPESRSGRPVAAAIVGFVALYTLVAGLVWWHSGKPPFPPPNGPETLPIASPPSGAAETAPAMMPESDKAPASAETAPAPAAETAASSHSEGAEAVEEKKTPREVGYLTVRAVPWGAVTVDGAGRRWDTPASRIPLAAGRHSVRVRYEPDGVAATATVTVAPGKEIVCVANFRSGKELQCGK